MLDLAAHNAALALRFAGVMPKGKKSKWKYGGRHIGLRMAGGSCVVSGNISIGLLMPSYINLVWYEGQGEAQTHDGKPYHF